jgi:spermidine synthase
MTSITARERVPVRILLIFVLSGAAGLIDEIVWSRQLVLVFGNTTQAVSAILTGFFGGMAIGSAVGGRVADRIQRPLRLYGWLEVVLAGIVIATPLTFRLINEVYRGIYPSLEGSPQALALVRMALAVLALAPATVLMGATLPTLTRYLTRSGHLSAAFGKLYAANTIGAIVGTLVAGLVLIELVGLTGALAVGAACSGTAGLAALWMSRQELDVPVAPATLATAPAPAPATAAAPSTAAVPSSPLMPSPRPDRTRLALAIAFVSGLTSLGYQVLWTRMLASGTGNTTYVFTAILGTFLLGLAIGALLFNLIRPRLGDPTRLLATAQILVGALVLFGLVMVIARPAASLNPYEPLEVVHALIISVVPVVLLTTIVLGLIFPATSTLLPQGGSHTGRSAGTFLAVNTVGAICGSFLVPFLLIPTIGSPHAAALLALVNVITGAAIALSSPSGRGITRWITPAAAGLVGVAIVAASLAPAVLVSPNEARLRLVGATIFGVAEDEIATVEAGQVRSTPELWVAGTSMTLLTVDAKLMPILPLIARPASTHALVVAFGMGTAFRSALIAGLHTDVVELVPSVPEMFPFYYPDAAAVLDDPNGHVIIADGRNHLELTDKRYDIIVTDPPPPIESSGASVITSREYYEAGHAHLTPNGIMMEWVPYGQTIDEFKTHIRAFTSVFPNVTIVFSAGGYGTYMLGSDAPVAFDHDSIQAVLSRPGILADISSSFDSPTNTIAGWTSTIDRLTWISGPAVTAFTGPGPMVTDDRPLSEYFLLRRLAGSDSPRAVPSTLLPLTASGG